MRYTFPNQTTKMTLKGVTLFLSHLQSSLSMGRVSITLSGWEAVGGTFFGRTVSASVDENSSIMELTEVKVVLDLVKVSIIEQVEACLDGDLDKASSLTVEAERAASLASMVEAFTNIASQREEERRAQIRQRISALK